MRLHLLALLTMFTQGTLIHELAGEDHRNVILHVSDHVDADYSTIQAAVNAAPPGAIIRIGPGTFTGSVRITKPVQLEGAGPDKTLLSAEYFSLFDLVEREWSSKDEQARFESLKKKVIEEKGEGPATAIIWEEFGPKPTLLIENSQNVILRNLSITMPGTVRKGGWQEFNMVTINNAGVDFKNCGFVGSAVNGVSIQNVSEVVLHGCLIAGIRSSGIVVDSLEKTRVRIKECEIRKCGYAGVKIRGPGDVQVDRCLISHIEYHGVRYDDAKPVISKNVFREIKRVGIYIDGTSNGVITNNLFLNCVCGGRADRIENNTFYKIGKAPSQAAHFSAISTRGTERQLVRRNVIKGYAHGVLLSSTDKQPVDQESKVIEENLIDVEFAPVVSYETVEPKSSYAKRKTPVVNAIPRTAQNWICTFEFTDPMNADFSIQQSLEFPDEIDFGAKDFASPESHWSEHFRERAMIDRIQQVKSSRQ